MKQSSVATIALAAVVMGSGATNAAAGSFAAMSYNVRGLPPQVIEDRTAQMALIAPKLEDFHTAGGAYEGQKSIVALQELFYQAYYNTLTNPATVSYPFVTPKDTGGPNGIGDGLTTMSDFAYFDLLRTKWNDCFGTGGANGSDCDTNKGFTYARVQIEQGIFVEVYDLHADAGQDSGSRTARRANVNQLIDAINTTSPQGDAVIVMGDTNSRYTRVAADQDNIDSLLTATGVKDVWVELVNGGVVPGPGPDNTSGCDLNPSGAACEMIDKIFYRSGVDVTLTPIGYAALKNLFSDGSGNDLSDHYPAAAAFDYTIVASSTSTTSSSTTTSSTSSTLLSPVCGDPALPDKVLASDALWILKAAVGQPLECLPCNCDVDSNTEIRATDALRVLKYAVGQQVTLTCPPC